MLRITLTDTQRVVRKGWGKRGWGKNVAQMGLFFPKAAGGGNFCSKGDGRQRDDYSTGVRIWQSGKLGRKYPSSYPLARDFLRSQIPA
jgi:hypothetical protein